MRPATDAQGEGLFFGFQCGQQFLHDAGVELVDLPAHVVEGLDVGNFDLHGLFGGIAHHQEHEALFGHFVHGQAAACFIGVFTETKSGLSKFFRHLCQYFADVAQDVVVAQAESGGHFAAVGFQFAALGENQGLGGQVHGASLKNICVFRQPRVKIRALLNLLPESFAPSARFFCALRSHTSKFLWRVDSREYKTFGK